MKPKLPGSLPDVRKTSFKIPLTFVTTLITNDPGLEQSLSQQYVVWLASCVWVRMTVF